MDSLKINFKKTFYIEYNNKIVSYISYVDTKNESKIKKILIKNISKNLFKNLLLVLINFKFFFKLHDQPKKFIQLMHLIIKFDENKNKKDKKKLNKKIENLHKKMIKNKYNGIYALFENKNLVANKYYKKIISKFLIKIFLYFCKKKIRNT